MRQQPGNSRANNRIVVVCLALVAGMAGMSYAAVPLYRVFCQVTGFGGTTQRADAPADITIDRKMKIRFDSNVASALNWQFEPAQRQVEIRVGEQTMAFYRAENLSNREVTGTATFNVSPASAGAYFSKIECFCFTEQTLKPGQGVDMPVVFFIDPEIDRDEDLKTLKTITLSYTFYGVDNADRTTAETRDDGTGTILN